jgi:hypothetical protein
LGFVSAIPSAALFISFARQRCLGVLLGSVKVDHSSARLPDTAPFPYKGPLPKKIPLHGEAVIAVHAACRMVAFEVDRAGGQVLIGN